MKQPHYEAPCQLQVEIVERNCDQQGRRIRQTNKKIITIHKQFLGTCIKSKKQHIYSTYQQVKILQTSPHLFGSSAYQGSLS